MQKGKVLFASTLHYQLTALPFQAASFAVRWRSSCFFNSILSSCLSFPSCHEVLLPTPPLDPHTHVWLKDAGALRLMTLCAEAGGEMRFVGGVVRDALLGLAVGDIDLAVNLTPDVMMDLAQKAHIKLIPTGLSFGTVTAVIDGRPYEITSLRQDVETDGRHARVTYTTDWAADAARRDLTINALSATAEGRVFDYGTGLDDLAARRLRFIGCAEDRLKEDILRLLRLFRFAAQLPAFTLDPEALRACQATAPLLGRLSRERVGNEIRKMMATPDPSSVWRLMREHRITPVCLPEATADEALNRLIGHEKRLGQKPDPIRRLAALVETGDALRLANRLAFSKNEARRLTRLQALATSTPSPEWNALLYAEGAVCARDLLLLRDNLPADAEALVAGFETWSKPVFPLNGNDLKLLGLQDGPLMGQILRAVETWWVAEAFHPSAAACRAKAETLIHQPG